MGLRARSVSWARVTDNDEVVCYWTVPYIPSSRRYGSQDDRTQSARLTVLYPRIP